MMKLSRSAAWHKSKEPEYMTHSWQVQSYFCKHELVSITLAWHKQLHFAHTICEAVKPPESGPVPYELPLYSIDKGWKHNCNHRANLASYHCSDIITASALENGLFAKAKMDKPFIYYRFISAHLCRKNIMKFECYLTLK